MINSVTNEFFSEENIELNKYFKTACANCDVVFLDILYEDVQRLFSNIFQFFSSNMPIDDSVDMYNWYVYRRY